MLSRQKSESPYVVSYDGPFLAILAAIALGGISASPVFGQSTLPQSEERIIQYDSTENLSDPIALLQKRLAQSAGTLAFETNRGYLPSLLDALQVPVSSQTLVFSKTSSQRTHTSPETPRALYFNDSVSVGWAPGASEIDIAAVDPNRGPIFYTLDQKPLPSPRFNRPNNCMQCHLGPKTQNVPGLLVRSYYTASNGTPLAPVTEFVNGHNSPLSARWGGWYVTGTSADSHLGNMFVDDVSHSPQFDIASVRRTNIVTDIHNRFQSARYLSSGSDIVALLVVEHQVRMQNLLTLANYETRYALDPEMARTGSRDWPQQRIASAGERLLQYMLFRNEAPFSGAVKGERGFSAEFQNAGPRDSKGRSLREFDLDIEKRLFKYPCSFLVYSPSFDALPAEMKNYLWRRLDQILSGHDQSPTYATMSKLDREHVFEILRDTKPEFAAWLEKQQRLAAN